MTRVLALLCVWTVLAVLSGSAWAQDAAVKATLDDLARLEPQISALTPGQGAGIKRVQNLLKVTQQRFAGANQGDPDYPAAADRLAKAEAALADLAAGKTPEPAPAAPAATSAEPPAAAPATAPSADPKVAAAQAHLDALNAAVAATQPNEIDKIQQQRSELDQLAREITAAQNPGDPAWVAAANGYNDLVAQMNALIAAANSGGGAAAPSGGGGDANVARAEHELGLIERQVEPMQPGDARLAERFLADLDRIGQTLDALPDKTTAEWQAADAHRAKLKGTIVEKRVAALKQTLQQQIDRVNTLDATDFAVAETVDGLQRDLDGIRAGLDALSAPQDPGVVALGQDIAQVAGAIDQRAQSAGAAVAQYGDVNARLAEIDGHARGFKVPPPLTGSATKDEAAAYGVAIAGIRRQSAEDLAWLDSINGKVPLTADQVESFNRSQSALAVVTPQEVNQSLLNSQAALDAAVQQGLTYADLLNNADTGNADDQANLITGAGKFEEYQKNLETGLVAVDAAAALDGAVARTDAPDRAAQRAKIAGALEKYQGSHSEALASVRMPEARSSDAELVAIAEEVLRRPEYGYQWKRLVVNADLQHFDKMTGSIDENTSSDLVVSVYHWVWDEFQVTTAEQRDGRWYLYANKLRHFTSGGPTTPTGRWILADRFEGSEILEANIAE
ncbi:hypothetical protein [Dongia sp.]|uniref:hypothetical protein n=1 Tax=Dongia sp. TaxID=1977262 RepID=UPI00375368CB